MENDVSITWESVDRAKRAMMASVASGGEDTMVVGCYTMNSRSIKVLWLGEIITSFVGGRKA